jgi:putative DNA primase/helicase
MMNNVSPEEALLQAGAVFETSQPTAPEGSDIALADIFSTRHAGQLLYVPTWGHWLRWDGFRWAKDATLAVFDLARAICRDAAREAEHRKEDNAVRLASASTVAAVERLARSDRRHARAADAFDADPWALNTPGGVVDLRTGQLRPQRPGEMVTKVAAVTPGGDCPRWRAFVLEIVQGDAALAAYLQRWAGYMLTGETREHAFLVMIGPGGNGKTLLVNVLSFIVGDYAATAPMETFMVTTGERHPTDLAGMQGARLVVAQETEAGRALAEAKIKTLTGGDPISARFMRGDFFTYRPSFKLVMVGNHRPVIRNPDDALRRRMHLLPLTFKPDHPDPALFDTLRAEAAGILQWAIDGCCIWQAEGLGVPEAVKAATDDFFADQDLIAQWLAERCEARRDARAPSSALFRDWSGWCEARGEYPGSGKRFSSALERHYAKQRGREGALFLGLRLRPSDTGVL